MCIVCDYAHWQKLITILLLPITVKPYIPYDMVPSDYTLPMATSASGQTLQSRKLSVPDWVVDSDIVMQPVR